MRNQLFQFMKVERAIRLCARSCANDAPARTTLSEIESTLAEVAERLKSIDSHYVARNWLDGFAARCEMLSSLRHSEAAQSQIRRALFPEINE